MSISVTEAAETAAGGTRGGVQHASLVCVHRVETASIRNDGVTTRSGNDVGVRSIDVGVRLIEGVHAEFVEGAH